MTLVDLTARPVLSDRLDGLPVAIIGAGPGGLAAAERLAVAAPRVRVVMLTTFGEDEYVARALAAGAAGVVVKDTGPEDLIHAVRAAANGHAVLYPPIAR